MSESILGRCLLKTTPTSDRTVGPTTSTYRTLRPLLQVARVPDFKLLYKDDEFSDLESGRGVDNQKDLLLPSKMQREKIGTMKKIFRKRRILIRSDRSGSRGLLTLAER